jgi:polyisoprenyl-phosphate glycosyltransferase
VSLTHSPRGIDVPDVTVVLPCFNERDHVELEIKRIRAALEAAGMSYELICVDDGSTDGTGDLLQTIGGIRVIRLPRNQGSGTARRIGTQQARGRVVVWTDADLTYPNERIPELVGELDDSRSRPRAPTTVSTARPGNR